MIPTSQYYCQFLGAANALDMKLSHRNAGVIQVRDKLLYKSTVTPSACFINKIKKINSNTATHPKPLSQYYSQLHGGLNALDMKCSHRNAVAKQVSLYYCIHLLLPLIACITYTTNKTNLNSRTKNNRPMA